MTDNHELRPLDDDLIDPRMVDALCHAVGPAWLNRAMRLAFEGITPEQLVEAREVYRAEVEAETAFHDLTEDLTRQAYKAHTRNFIAAATDADSLKGRWKDERYLRRHCRIHEEDYEELRSLVDQRLEELGEPRRRLVADYEQRRRLEETRCPHCGVSPDEVRF